MSREPDAREHGHRRQRRANGCLRANASDDGVHTVCIAMPRLYAHKSSGRLRPDSKVRRAVGRDGNLWAVVVADKRTELRALAFDLNLEFTVAD
ncbi:MAG: hypothetical protein HOI95_08660 [Chromatiales bacterium]|nr:hypothetical protein [Chromatiales bacterium]